MNNTKQRERIIRSAILTAGSGPIVNSAYKTLTQYTHLSGVVFSRYTYSEPRWKKLKKYGVWYVLQYLASKILNILTGNTDINRLLPSDVSIKVWQSQKEKVDVIDWLQNLNVDLVIVSDIHYILTSDFLKKFRYCINIHPSLLPRYRGPHPIIWGLLDKNAEFGITLHLIDEGIDTGDIICQRAIKKPIFPLSFLIEVKLAKVLPELIVRTIEEIQIENLHTQKQEEGFYISFPTLTNRKIRKQEIAESRH